MIQSEPKLTLAVPEGQRYSCRQCGWCCRWWKIEVTPAERDRLLGRDWAKDSPRLEGVQLFWEHSLPDQAQPAIQTAHLRGRCVFLEEDGLCLIHAVLGEDAKPSSCRRFPVITGFVNCEPLVAVDYSCSSAVRNGGEPFERVAGSASRWLADASRGLHSEPELQPVLRDSLTLRWGAYTALEHALLEIVAAPDSTTTDRLAAGSELIFIIADGMPAMRGPLSESEVLERLRATSKGSHPARTTAVPPILPPLGLLAPMVADVEVPHTPMSGRGSGAIGYALAIATRAGSLHLSTLAATVDLEAASSVTCDADAPELNELLTRFLANYVLRKSLLKSDTVETGWSYLAGCVGLIEWYTRASAAIRGMAAADGEDLATAIQVVEKAFVP